MNVKHQSVLRFIILPRTGIIANILFIIKTGRFVSQFNQGVTRGIFQISNIVTGKKITKHNLTGSKPAKRVLKS